MSIRTQRVSEQVRAELARLLREETSDPRIGLLTITRVKVSPDFSTALVFWSPLDVDGETDIEEVGAGLASAAGFLRGRLGALLRLRRTPELAFRHDASVEEGSRVLGLLRNLPDVGARATPPDESDAGAGSEDAEGAGRHGEEA